MKSVSITVALVIIALWWVFSLLWLPGYVHNVASLSYSINRVYPPQSTAVLARDRALHNATRGVVQNSDIFFTDNELSHLQDVYLLYRPMAVTLNVLATTSWLLLLGMYFRKQRFDHSLLLASKVLLGLLTTLVIGLVFFGISFTLFHQVLFPQGNWAFPEESMLITLFPLLFWRLLLLSAIVGIGAFAILYQLLSKTEMARTGHDA